MGTRCELCIETEIDPIIVCRRSDTPLVQGRWEEREGRDGKVLKEKMERCPIYMLFKGAGEIIETDDGVIRLKPQVQEVQTAEVALAASR